MSIRRALSAAVVAAFAGFAAAEPLGTSFTYQGELRDAGELASGVYDLRFRLYSDAVGLTQVGSTLCMDDVTVVDGKFTVSLDFGPVFTGQAQYLEMDVRGDSDRPCSTPTGFETLTPRQRVSAAPNAAYASTATTAITANTATNATTLNSQPASFYSNAANLTGTLSDARLSSNVTTLTGQQTFIGQKIFSAAPAFTSTTAAPFTVNTTNKVMSLNADYLDNFDSSAFALATHTHDANSITSGILADGRLSPNVPRLNGANTYSGTNRFNAYVGVNRSSPFSASEVFGIQNAPGQNGYAGMYVTSTDTSGGLPFYGYGVNGYTSWSTLNSSGLWQLFVGGSPRLTVDGVTGNTSVNGNFGTSGNATVAGNLSAANMPAIKRVSGSASGTLVQSSTTVLTSGPINVPAAGYLRITGRCRVMVSSQNLAQSTATLRLVDSTAAPVIIKIAKLGMNGGLQQFGGAGVLAELEVDFVQPVTAGVRSYYLWLVHESFVNTESAYYEDPSITFEYFPEGL